jgi:Helitron helicase-like domain at N-terminus
MRDVVVNASSGYQRINDMHSSYDPLQYPLIFPNGTQGWNISMSMSARKYYAFHGFSRLINRNTNPLDLAGSLSQVYWVDQFCKIENARLCWLRKNQQKLRLTTRSNIKKAIQNGSQKIGKIILPSSHVGSAKYYYQQFLDAMAGVRKYGSPDLFITMTANLQWKEIQENLIEGQQAIDSPMLVNRVFREKLKALKLLLQRKSPFGRAIAYISVIEFQKRGIPHAHLIVILHPDQKMCRKTTDELNQFVSAELPDPEIQPNLFDKVTTHMVHKPCHLVPAPCTKQNSFCKAKYPKPFQEHTTIDENGFIQYKRRQNNIFVEKIYSGTTVKITNSNVVPYNPTLLMLFNCHINVEIVSSIASVKYLYKYIHKGTPMACISIESHDEIEKYVSGRFVSPGDACWRILGFPLIEKNFSVQRLPVHLPDMQSVIFQGDEYCYPLIYNRSSTTKLTAFFKYCEDNPHIKITYQDIPLYAVWNSSKKQWVTSKNQCERIGRLYNVKPYEGERFYLRVLLNHVISPKSFKNLKTYRGIQYPTFQDAAKARGLTQMDDEINMMLSEAASYEMPEQFRTTFATQCLFLTLQQIVIVSFQNMPSI